MTKRGTYRRIGLAARRLFFALLLAISICTSVCGEEKPADVDQLNLGRQLLESGNLSEAAGILEQIVPSHQDYQAARVVLVTCYRYIGIELYGQSRCDDAIAVWRKALGLEPENTRIKTYIHRCESESKGIARISGDSVGAVKSQPLPQQEPPARVDKVIVPGLIEAHTPTDSTGMHSTIASRTPITVGLSTGIALATGDSELPNSGMAFIGSLSILPPNYRWGVRLDGSYSRWYRNSNGATIAASHRTVSGLSISALVHAEEVRSSAMQLGAGIGVYEAILTEPTVDPLGSITRRSTVVGIPLGLRLHRDLGPVAATFEARSTYLYGSLTPDFFQFMVGFTSN